MRRWDGGRTGGSKEDEARLPMHAHGRTWASRGGTGTRLTLGFESPRSQRAQETPGSKLVLLPWETAEAEQRSKGTQKPGWPSALDCGFATNLPHTPQNSMLSGRASKSRYFPGE